MIYESTRKMSVKEQEVYDLGYLNGKHAAMCSPWVKTSDRLPEGGEMELVQGAYQHREWGFMLHEIIAIGWLKSHPEMYPYWMPLPKPPEGGV